MRKQQLPPSPGMAGPSRRQPGECEGQQAAHLQLHSQGGLLPLGRLQLLTLRPGSLQVTLHPPPRNLGAVVGLVVQITVHENCTSSSIRHDIFSDIRC